MKIFSLVVVCVIGGTVLLIGSSYLAMYLKLFFYSMRDSPGTTLVIAGGAAALLLLGNSRTLREKLLSPRFRAGR
jgi:hypothetical protein